MLGFQSLPHLFFSCYFIICPDECRVVQSLVIGESHLDFSISSKSLSRYFCISLIFLAAPLVLALCSDLIDRICKQ